MKEAWRLLGVVCALVIGVYAYTAHSGFLELLSQNAAETYYNLLVQGFRAGQLSLKTDAPPGLAQLADPYDPNANAVYRTGSSRTHDMSYYKGRLYLYFGVTPALILFWPFVALTGHYVLHKEAVTLFCAIGFLASVGLLHALWRRYFPEVSVMVVVACTLALGLATGLPVLLSRSDACEVSVSCGYMLTMLALGAIWGALHEPARRAWWLAAASLAYGLAVGARPSLLLGAVILLVPVIHARREQRQIWAPLVAAAGPIVLIGLGLMLYNALRFDNPFEFGWRYQLTPDRQDTAQQFSLRYLWFNFRVCFLEPVRLSGHFPFVQEIVVPPLPAGHGMVEAPFGILTNTPLVWLALAVPLTWRNRSAEARSVLRRFLVAVALFFGTCTLTIGLFFAACVRYEVELLPALVLLAVAGTLALERTLADRPVWRHAARWGWGLLLSLSVTFNLLASVERYAQGWSDLGGVLVARGRVTEAIPLYEQVLRLRPDDPKAHHDLGVALEQAGRLQEAIGHYEQALHLKPDYAKAQYNLGTCLLRAGRLGDAIRHWDEAARLRPDFAEAHYNLGVALLGLGRLQEAAEHLEQALRINPNYAETHNSLGAVLMRLGRLQEAVGHYEQAARLKPDYFDAHFNLAVALEQAGRNQDAIKQLRQALRINPDSVEGQHMLTRLRAVQPPPARQ